MNLAQMNAAADIDTVGKGINRMMSKKRRKAKHARHRANQEKRFILSKEGPKGTLGQKYGK